MAALSSFTPVFLPNSQPNVQLRFRTPQPSVSFRSNQKTSIQHAHGSLSFSCKSFSFPSPSTSAGSDTTTKSPSEIYSQLENSFRTGKFLTNDDIIRLKILQDYSFSQELDSGFLGIRVMREEELDDVVKLLSDSFMESMVLPVGYVSVMQFLVKQYVTERRDLLPHAVTLVAFYKGESEETEELAGTVEIFLSKYAFNTSPQSPTPPTDSPLICNLSVKTTFRRKGIGWNLLKASEELICLINGGGKVYLHCRMIDTAPFNLYTKAGYAVVKRDSFIVLLMLQRRKYLMCKTLTKQEESSSNQDIPIPNILVS